MLAFCFYSLPASVGATSIALRSANSSQNISHQSRTGSVLHVASSVRDIHNGWLVQPNYGEHNSLMNSSASVVPLSMKHLSASTGHLLKIPQRKTDDDGNLRSLAPSTDVNIKSKSDKLVEDGKVVYFDSKVSAKLLGCIHKLNGINEVIGGNRCWTDLGCMSAAGPTRLHVCCLNSKFVKFYSCICICISMSVLLLAMFFFFYVVSVLIASLLPVPMLSHHMLSLPMLSPSFWCCFCLFCLYLCCLYLCIIAFNLCSICNSCSCSTGCHSAIDLSLAVCFIIHLLELGFVYLFLCAW